MNKTNLKKTIFWAGLLFSGLSFSLFANPVKGGPGESIKLRVIAYNVACGQWATPERIAQELKVLKPDIVLLSEVPKVNRGKKVKDWSQRLADALGLDHVHVGTVSSAGHKSPTLACTISLVSSVTTNS